VGGVARTVRTTWSASAVSVAEPGHLHRAIPAAWTVLRVTLAGLLAVWAWCPGALARQTISWQCSSSQQWATAGFAGDPFSDPLSFDDPLAGIPHGSPSDLTSALSQMQWLLDVEPGETKPGFEHLAQRSLLAWPLFGRGNAVELFTRPSADVYLALARHYVIRPKAKLRRIQTPPGRIAIDFHVHTCYSHDSLADVRQVLRAAARRGLAGVAITDHNTIEGAREARPVASQMIREGMLPPNFLVIEGEEISSLQGHILGLFLSREIRPGMSAAETVEAIHGAGGLAVAAHPRLGDGVGALASTLPFDAVETKNGAEEIEFAVATRSAQSHRDAFYAGITKPRTGGSDAHDPASVGVCYTLLECAPTAEGVRAAILAGRTSPCSEWSRAQARRSARHGLLGGLLALQANMELATGGLSAWARHVTRADAAQVSLWPQPGVTLTKEF